jgi:hypothetical protein
VQSSLIRVVGVAIHSFIAIATLEALATLTTLVHPIANPSLELTIGYTRVVRVVWVFKVVIILNHNKHYQ